MTSIVTSGFGLPQAPFVTRALGKAIAQAFPTKSGVNRLLLYALQEESLRADEERRKAKEAPAPKVEKKKVVKAVRRKPVRSAPTVVEPAVDFSTIDRALIPLQEQVKRLEEQQPTQLLLISYFSSICFTGYLVADPLEAANDADEEIVLLLCA